MQQLALVLLGGAAGGVLRFWLSELIGRHAGDALPWGTLAVNLTGAFAIGCLAATLPAAGAAAPALWQALAVGLLGSYTTVSSFSLQTLALLQAGRPLRALAHVGISVTGCVGAAAAGWMLGAALGDG